MVSLEEAKRYMHIDHNDDDVFIGGCIIAADEYLKGAIGENYDNTSEPSAYACSDGSFPTLLITAAQTSAQA